MLVSAWSATLAAAGCGQILGLQDYTLCGSGGSVSCGAGGGADNDDASMLDARDATRG
jgi:hypothetical protein